MGVRRLRARFLTRCYSIFYACIRYRPTPVGTSERLTRFFFYARQEVDGAGRVKYRAFFHARGEPISVIRTDSMTESDIWAFGNRWVANLRERELAPYFPCTTLLLRVPTPEISISYTSPGSIARVLPIVPDQIRSPGSRVKYVEM